MSERHWGPADRESALAAVKGRNEPWDLIIAGGGITGAGVAREAARAGLNVLLVERQDFSWGTSSRSSKMVHGGLRYIAQGDIRTTMHSVHERERLMREAPGLVDLMPYMMPHYKGRFPGPFLFGMLLRVYDFLAGKRYRRFWSAEKILSRFPFLRQEGLRGVTEFADAVTDDSRLVMRVLHEACSDGAVALNYTAVCAMQQDASGASVVLSDQESGEEFTVQARAVVNATGVWANTLREGQTSELQTIRPARGSHILIPAERLPVDVSFTVLHPRDQRPIFVYPWLGRTVIGTTDLDTPMPGNEEIGITRDEVDYLYELSEFQFPGLGLSDADVISTWAGIRPLVSSGASDSSGEKRDHTVWKDGRLISVSGGKLTTFRLIALDVLDAAKEWLADGTLFNDDAPVFAASSSLSAHPDPALWKRLSGHYGEAVAEQICTDTTYGADVIEGTGTLWAELAWCARNEAIVHLDDLLLRRTRVGLLGANGGLVDIPRLHALAEKELGWDEERWLSELERYQSLHSRYYALPAA